MIDINVDTADILKLPKSPPIHRKKNNRRMTPSEKLEILSRYYTEPVGLIATDLGLTTQQVYRVVYITRKIVEDQLVNNVDNLDIDTIIKYKKLSKLVKSKRGVNQRKTPTQILNTLVENLDL